MTFLAWIYHEQTEGPIFYYANAEYGVRFLLKDDRFIARLCSSNLTLMEGLASDILEPKMWHFVGASYNFFSGELILWINGSFHKKRDVPWPDELATQQGVILGAVPGVAGEYKGRMSCVQLYDRVLSESEIEDAKQLCFKTGETFLSLFCSTLSL